MQGSGKLKRCGWIQLTYKAMLSQEAAQAEHVIHKMVIDKFFE